MNTEKQRSFLISFLYYGFIIGCCYIFFRYILSMMMPFFIGFMIAFLLRPLIRKLSKFGHERLWSMIVILIFYALLGSVLIWLLMKSFFYVREWMEDLPQYYETYIEPNLHTSLVSAQDAMEHMDINVAEIFSTIIKSVQNSLSSLINQASKAILNSLTNIMTSLPKIGVSFFFAVISSFFINSDYAQIMTFLHKVLPEKVQAFLSSLQCSFRTTLKQLLIAYTKLMILTFLELWIGLYILGVEHVFLIALGIALFDIVPVLGTAGVMVPWAFLAYLNGQPKLAVGLIVLNLIITLIRNVIEPRIIGKQIGLHPLLMLLSMYIGAKLFGIFGVIFLPFGLLLCIQQNKKNI